MAIRKEITDEIDALVTALPPHIYNPVARLSNTEALLEVVMDLGRRPEARFASGEMVLSDREISEEDIEYVVARIGQFGGDNRAGIERTLHRISAIRNRKGRIVGLTCRIGRAVYGSIALISDLVQTGKSMLLLGRPGVGKTTMLREIARVLADDFRKRVIVVDTSNEIAGDGDIPHPGIGRARRMQVPTPALQHAVMIEAVENHMPEVIVIDEIGTELEAAASRTIAERGVQLVATAHGNALENLMLNPTLSDLIGGIQTVTLSDEEARRRGTQKSVLERKAPPTFDIVVEIISWSSVAIHPDVAEAVDSILRGQPTVTETREMDEKGQVRKEEQMHMVGTEATPVQPLTLAPTPTQMKPTRIPTATGRAVRVYPFGISRPRLEQAIRELHAPAKIANGLRESDVVMTLKNYYRKRPPLLRDAESSGLPVYVLRNNTLVQMEQCLRNLCQLEPEEEAVDPVAQALQEAESASESVLAMSQPMELSPQSSYVRRLQHQIAERYSLSSQSVGREPHRRVRIFKDHD
ncbi:MAG: AAA family ATPase [Chloroflexota bacterium]|nr:MAG: AAA family ATPase [Chloroflexota bacterium]